MFCLIDVKDLYNICFKTDEWKVELYDISLSILI